VKKAEENLGDSRSSLAAAPSQRKSTRREDIALIRAWGHALYAGRDNGFDVFDIDPRAEFDD
jgi:hypothetical protein